ncbi:hypothetical protein KKE06_06055 [Candidatus Micrarchaeota archaeon]|nr:hypothetical protein [Candidatus Micrarchaeota archaeon]MBU1929886.1 hypothetical protein [Candidatus Micrarchaeota archaeon]
MKSLFVDSKGQGSLEIMIIAAAVIMLGTLFSSIYLASQDTTIALVIAKNLLTEQLNTLEEPTILSSVRYTVNSSINKICMVVKTTPYVSLAGTTSAIETEIVNSTSFATASISFTDPPPEYITCN